MAETRHTNDPVSGERAAKSQAATWRANDPSDQSDGPEHRAIIEVFEIAPTKAGILEALNRHVSYPDNG